MKDRNRKRCPRLECLESRELLSWTPATIPYQIAAPVGGTVITNNALYNHGVVTTGWQQVTFVANRTGTWTFKVDASGSSIDPILALFGPTGRELGYYGNGQSHDIACTFQLTAHTRYEFGISNYTGTPNGSFTTAIIGPSDYVGLSNNEGSGIQSQADAYLNGNTLVVDLYGWNSSNLYKFNHRVYVYLDNASGMPIHTGSFWASGWTYGWLLGGPGTLTMHPTWDLSSWNLTNVDHIHIVLY